MARLGEAVPRDACPWGKPGEEGGAQTMTAELPERHRYLHRIGPTPLVPVQLDPHEPVVWCKLEFLNPSGSTKDRLARFILEKAWRQGQVKAGDTVIEAS